MPAEPQAPRQRWFTALLLEYNLRDSFLDRDAGLFYEGLKANGVDAKYVAIGEASFDRRPEVLLAPLGQLSDPMWWRQWALDGVVLYSWARPRFTPVAAAIRESGARLVLVLDSDGYAAPAVSRWMYLRNKFYREKENGVLLPRTLALFKMAVASLRLRHRPVLRHLEFANAIALPSEPARARYEEYLKWLGRADLANRLTTVPYPVSERMSYDPSIRKKRVLVAVGGWNRLQKNAPLLVRVLNRVLRQEPEWSAEIIGPGEALLEKLMDSLGEHVRSRIRIAGPVPNADLPATLQRSRISLCTSYHESFHLATGEALCCGCSFVGDGRIPAMEYFASLAPCGTVARDLSEDGMAAALLEEMRLWETGQRDPVLIGKTWAGLLHPKSAAGRILASLGSTPRVSG